MVYVQTFWNLWGPEVHYVVTYSSGATYHKAFWPDYEGQNPFMFYEP